MERSRKEGIGALPPSQARYVNQVCERYEAAWREGTVPRIEESLRQVPEAARSALFTELLALELELRRGRGERPTPKEYLDRFPEQARSIGDAFDMTARAAGRASRLPTGTHRDRRWSSGSLDRPPGTRP